MPGSGGQVEKQGWVPAGKKRVTVTQRKQCWPCVSLRQIIKVDTVYLKKIIPHGRRQGWPAKEGSEGGVERDHGNCTGCPLLQPGWNWLMKNFPPPPPRPLSPPPAQGSPRPHMSPPPSLPPVTLNEYGGVYGQYPPPSQQQPPPAVHQPVSQLQLYVQY